MLVGEGMVNMVGTTARVASTACSYTNQYRVVYQGVSGGFNDVWYFRPIRKKPSVRYSDEFFGEAKEYQVVE